MEAVKPTYLRELLSLKRKYLWGSAVQLQDMGAFVFTVHINLIALLNLVWAIADWC